MESKFSPAERARICAEADYYTGRAPRPAWLDPKPAPASVRKDAPMDLVRKVHISEPVAADTGQQWADYIERQISDALAPFEEAVGCVIAEERQREREEIKA